MTMTTDSADQLVVPDVRQPHSETTQQTVTKHISIFVFYYKLVMSSLFNVVSLLLYLSIHYKFITSYLSPVSRLIISTSYTFHPTILISSFLQTRPHHCKQYKYNTMIICLFTASAVLILQKNSTFFACSCITTPNFCLTRQFLQLRKLGQVPQKWTFKNRRSTIFLQAKCRSCCRTNNVKALQSNIH